MGPVSLFDPVLIYANNCVELENDTKQALREGYSYSEPYASGEIFRFIRLCHYNNDATGEKRWRARFSVYQEKYLNIILNRKVLIEALDSVPKVYGELFP